MLLTWSPHGKNDVRAAVDYLTAPVVTKPLAGRPHSVVRSPAPETLSGNAQLVTQYTNALPFQCRYAVATLSFAQEDICVEAFRRGDSGARNSLRNAANLCVAFAYCGIPARARPPILVAAQTHTGRVELSITLPRAAGMPGARLYAMNPNPPTAASRAGWNALVDVLNDQYGWADPRDPLRRQWLTAPGWMVSETAEIRRAKSSGARGFDLSAPWFQAWRLCRAAARDTEGDRDEIVARLNAGLACHNWGVTSQSRRGLTCGPLTGPGQHVTFTGAVLRGGEDDAIDPFDAIRARQFEILEAPMRLDEAIARRWEANRRLRAWSWVDPPDPMQFLSSTRPAGSPREILMRALERIAARTRLTIRSHWLAKTLLKHPTDGFRTIVAMLNELNDRYAAPRPTPPFSDRNPDRPAAPNARSRGPSPRRQAGSVSDRHFPDRARDDIGGREPDPSGAETRRSTLPFGFGPRRGPDRNAARGGDLPSGPIGRAAGSVVPARWSRGRWLREVGRLARRWVGACTLAWGSDAAGTEGIFVQTSHRAVWVPVTDHSPDAEWEARVASTLRKPAPASLKGAAESPQ
ncbi:hypothetical protein SAMN05421764_1312 [Donghicola eburneus]|nr:hypothetical protein SAMN05421764_1312 [Donghicola eburneus]